MSDPYDPYPPRKPNEATEKQIDFIYSLGRAIGWEAAAQVSERALGRDVTGNVAGLSKRDASRFIDALQKEKNDG